MRLPSRIPLPPRVFLALVLVCFLPATLGWQSCDDPRNPLVLSSTTAEMRIGGHNATFYAKNPDTGLTDYSSWIAYQVKTIEERKNPTMPGICWDYPIINVGMEVSVLRLLIVTDLQCSAKIVDEILAPGVSAKVVVLSYTLASNPNLTLQLNYSVANASLDINEGSSPHSEGRDMIVSYRPDQVKQTFKITGWDWQGTPADQSYIGFYFDVYVGSDQEYYLVGNQTEDSGYVELRAHNVTLRQSLDRMVKVDGVVRFKRFNYYGGLETWSPGDPLMANGGMTSCYVSPNGTYAEAVHFSELDYDPQFSVIFGNVEEPTSTPSPAAALAKRVRNAATVVAISVSVAVVAVVLATVFVVSFKTWIRPYWKRTHADRTHNLSKEHVEPESEPPQHSGWVKATKGTA